VPEPSPRFDVHSLFELCRVLRGDCLRGDALISLEVRRALSPGALAAAAEVPELNHLRELCRTGALRGGIPRGR